MPRFNRKTSTIPWLLCAEEIQRSADFEFRTAAGKLGGERPEIGAVFAVKGIDPETVLLDMVGAAEADPEDVVGLAHAGVGG